MKPPTTARACSFHHASRGSRVLLSVHEAEGFHAAAHRKEAGRSGGITEPLTVAYCADVDREQFAASQLIQDAVLRNIELIGEAAVRIPDEMRLAHPEIAWREIVAMRNQFIHGYLGIDLDVVWDVVQVELPLLIRQLALVLD